MPKKAAFITVHGMGRTDLNYNQEIVQKLEGRLGSLPDNIYMGKVYYQDILQSNEDHAWHSVLPESTTGKLPAAKQYRWGKTCLGHAVLAGKRFRQSWPAVRIIFRGDSGFFRRRMLA